MATLEEIMKGEMAKELDEQRRNTNARGTNARGANARNGPPRGAQARGTPPQRGYQPGIPPQRGYQPGVPTRHERFVSGGPKFPTAGEVYGPQGFNGQALAGPPVVYPTHDPDMRFPSDANMTIDPHEILKAHMFEPLPGAFGDQYHFEKNRPSPYGITGISDQYVVLDSYEKNEASSNMNRGVLKFDFAVQGVTREQAIGVRDKVDTVTEIQICPFCIPIPADSAAVKDQNSAGVTLVAGASALPDPGFYGTATGLPNCNRVTLELKEIGLQSISDRNLNRHTFELEATEAPAVNKVSGNPDVVDRLELTPPDGWDRWNFTEPIQDIHALTVVFRDGDIPLNMAKDCINPSRVFMNAAGFLEFQFPEVHGLVIGDRIFIENYELDIPAGQPNTTILKAYDTYINGKGGLIVGSDSFSSLTFEPNPRIDPKVPYAVAPLGLVPGDTIPLKKTVKVYIAKNRIRIPLRMRRVVQRLTNYDTPTSS